MMKKGLKIKEVQVEMKDREFKITKRKAKQKNSVIFEIIEK